MTSKHRWIEMGIAIALSAVVILGYPFIEREFNRNAAIADYFAVRQLEVAPITSMGEIPIIVFDRIVNKDFKAEWTMEVQSVDGENFNTFCAAKGQKEYDAGETLENQGESTIWFTDKFPECRKIKDKIGRYRIIVIWNIDRGSSYYDYKLEKISNVFEIVGPETFIPIKEQEALNKTERETEDSTATAAGETNE